MRRPGLSYPEAMNRPNGPRRVGNEAAWASYFENRPEKKVTVDSIVVAASQDLGYVFGRHANASVDGDGNDGGRYVAIWRKRDAAWQLVLLSAHVHADIQPSFLRTPK